MRYLNYDKRAPRRFSADAFRSRVTFETAPDYRFRIAVFAAAFIASVAGYLLWSI